VVTSTTFLHILPHLGIVRAYKGYSYSKSAHGTSYEIIALTVVYITISILSLHRMRVLVTVLSLISSINKIPVDNTGTHSYGKKCQSKL